MNTPRLWFTPENFPEELTPSYDHANSPNYISFIQGKALEGVTTIPCFKVAAPRSRLAKYDVFPNSIQIPLISPRVVSLLAEICPHDVQLFPAVIHTRDLPITDYSLLNVVAEVSGMDRDHSKFTMIPGFDEIMKVNKLRYLLGSMGKRHIAREREYHPFLWVSDAVVQRFAQEKIKGCAFEPPEAIRP